MSAKEHIQGKIPLKKTARIHLLLVCTYERMFNHFKPLTNKQQFHSYIIYYAKRFYWKTTNEL